MGDFVDGTALGEALLAVLAGGRAGGQLGCGKLRTVQRWAARRGCCGRRRRARIMARWVAEGEGGRSRQPCRRLFQRADDAPESSARAAASAPPSLPPAASARPQPTVCPRRARPTTLPDCVSHARCQRARIATHHARCCVGHPRPTALHRASRRLDRPALSHAETRMALARRASCEKPGSVTVGSLLPYILQPPAGSLLFPCLLQIHFQVHPLPFSSLRAPSRVAVFPCQYCFRFSCAFLSLAHARLASLP